MIETMIELAVDPSNGPNQKYLMAVLLEICKQHSPEANGAPAAPPKELDAAQTGLSLAKKLDLDSPKS